METGLIIKHRKQETAINSCAHINTNQFDNMAEKYSEEQLRLQDILIKSSNISERVSAARNPNTPIEALVAVARYTPNEDKLVVESANATISFHISSSIFSRAQYQISPGTIIAVYPSGVGQSNFEFSEKIRNAPSDEQFINENILKVPRKFKDNTARSFTISTSQDCESYYFQISVPKRYGTKSIADDAKKMLWDKLKNESEMKNIEFLVTNSYADSDTFVIAAIDVPNNMAVPIFRAITLVGMKMYFKYESQESEM